MNKDDPNTFITRHERALCNMLIDKHYKNRNEMRPPPLKSMINPSPELFMPRLIDVFTYGNIELFLKGICYAPFPHGYDPSTCNNTEIWFGSDIADKNIAPL